MSSPTPYRKLWPTRRTRSSRATNSTPAAGAPASSTKAATTTTAKPVAGVKTATASYCNRKETRSAACRSERSRHRRINNHDARQNPHHRRLWQQWRFSGPLEKTDGAIAVIVAS